MLERYKYDLIESLSYALLSLFQFNQKIVSNLNLKRFAATFKKGEVLTANKKMHEHKFRH